MSLIIENLSSSFGSRQVLKDLNLTVETGEFLTLLGASGSGKTTLLKSIAGLLPLDSGKIILNDRDITKLEAHQRKISYVFQDLRLFPHLTVSQNIAFPLKMHKVDKQRWEGRIEELLTKVQMEGYGQRNIAELSGGQQQRIALARALAIKPELLLLDEPFSGLDENLRLEMGQLIQSLHQDNDLTILMVTHDKREAIRYSSRIALLHQQTLHQVASPDQMVNEPKDLYTAEFFGRVNRIEGQVEDQVFTCSLGKWPLSKQLEDGEYTCIFRPSEGRLLKSSAEKNKDDIAFPIKIDHVDLSADFADIFYRVAGEDELWQSMVINNHETQNRHWLEHDFYLTIDPDRFWYISR